MGRRALGSEPNGNRLTAEGEAHGGGLPITATYDDQDRLLSYGNGTYTYTPNGELATKTVGGQTTSYVYDTLGNLIQVTLPNGDVITYTIDGRGRRVGKSVNGVRVKGWLYADQLRPIAELDGDGNLVSRFVYGTRANVPDYMIRGGATYRIYSDHLGSPRVIADAVTGEVVQRMDFHVFGELMQDSNPAWQPFGFAGGLNDPDTTLLRFGARDYDVVAGRWLAKDPVGLKAGLNTYEYVGGRPADRRDSSGLDWFRSSSDSRPYTVGREGSLVPPGGFISRLIEDWVSAGRTFGELHDEFVGATADMGLPDPAFNIPSMPGMYIYAVEQEAARSFKNIAETVKDWLRRPPAPSPRPEPPLPARRPPMRIVCP